jgi:hypothetical protein
VPIVGKNAAESLKPIRVAEFSDEFAGTLFFDDYAGDFFSHLPHAPCKPRGCFASVQGQVCYTSPIHMLRDWRVGFGDIWIIAAKPSKNTSSRFHIGINFNILRRQNANQPATQRIRIHRLQGYFFCFDSFALMSITNSSGRTGLGKYASTPESIACIPETNEG